MKTRTQLKSLACIFLIMLTAWVGHAQSTLTATVSSGNGTQRCQNKDVNFNINGTQNADVTYNLNGGPNTVVNLGSGGYASVQVQNIQSSQTLNLVSITDGTTTVTLNSSATIAMIAKPATPSAIVVTNSTCQPGCVVGGGSFTFPDCSSGATLVFADDVSGDNASNIRTTPPTYDQTHAMTFYYACVAGTIGSGGEGCPSEIQSVTTVPGSCPAQCTGNPPTCSISVTPCNTTYTDGVPTHIYLGYGPQCATLTTTTTGSNLSYSWTGTSTSALSCTNCANPVFTPGSAGTYSFTLTVSNGNGSSTCAVTFCVLDIRDHNNSGKVYICHTGSGNNTSTLSVSTNAVASHLANHAGDHLGTCTQSCGGSARLAKPDNNNTFVADEALAIHAYPNPFTTDLDLRIESNTFDFADIRVLDVAGRVIDSRKAQPTNTNFTIGHNLSSGVYMVVVKQGQNSKMTKIIKL